MTHYDTIIIGTGQAGPSLAARMQREGLAVAVVERDRLGGTCVNVGCIPTKALVASARAAHMARRAADFGVVLEGEVGVDMAKVKERMRGTSAASREGLEGWLESLEGVDLVRGHARFESATTVRVGDDLLEADRVVLNVGARPSAPPIPGLDEVRALTSTDLLELETLPEHLIIVGGSYIGLELGQIYRRFGSRVTIVERAPRLIGREDPEISESIRGTLEGEGVDIRTGVECVRLGRDGDGVVVMVDCEQGEPEIRGSHVLLAAGRRPNTDDLGLDAAGVEVDKRGYVVVDDHLRTSAPHVFALGDCNGKGAFTHTSYNDYEILAANLFDDDPRAVSDRITCYGLYVDPPLGRVGMTEAEARESGRDVLVGTRPMTRVGRAFERSETDGLIKILVDADSKEILGGAVLGIRGDEVVQALLPLMYAKAPYTVMSRAVHIHPTVTELLPTLLQGLRPLK